MSLLNHLRPKWQHSDADVRAEAVAELDKAEVDLLTAVAREDPDPRVRRIAVKKIERPRVLLEIAENDADGGVSAFAKERAKTLLVRIASDERDLEESRRALELVSEPKDIVTIVDQAKFDEIRQAAFESLGDDDALAELVRQSKNDGLRSRALERIVSPAALKSIILDEAAGDFALAALARLEDLPALEAIVSQHRLNKAVRRQAQTRLSSLAPADHPVKIEERAKRHEAICERAEALARELPSDLSAATSELETAWREIASEGPPSSELNERFERALAEARELESRREARRRQGETEAPTAGQAPAEPPALAPRAEVKAGATIVEELSRAEGAALAEAIAKARNEGVEGETLAEAEARLEAWKTALDLVEGAEEAAAIEDLDEAKKAFDALRDSWKSVSNAAPGEPTERWRRARESLKGRVSEARKAQDAEAQVQTLAELEQRTERLLALAAQEEVLIKDSERELREAQEFLKSMGPLPPSANRKKLRRKLSDARQALFAKTQETRDNEEWKRWANSDIQEGLIVRVEKLKESKDVPKIAKELRLIQEEWKRAGAAVPEKAEELWQRYKTIRDELKTRCDTFFEEQKKERGANLEKKLALCEKVEALKDSTEWRDTAEAIKAIQADWKSLGPVPNEMSDAVWKRFRAACDHFFSRRNEDLDRLKNERAENLKKKIALCERAEAIQASTDWAETANELKSLQAEWRTIGPVARNKSEAVWQRFRSACDYFFDRNKRRDEVEDEERAKSRLSLVDELEQMARSEGEGGDSLVDQALDIWRRWRQLGAALQAEADLSSRFENKLGAIVGSAPDAFKGSELDPAQVEQRRRKIVEQIEGLVSKDAGENDGASDSLQDLAARLKDALASNTMTGGKGRDDKREKRAAADEVRRLRTSWLKVAPLGGETGKALTERFDAAYTSFQQQQKQDDSGA